MKILERSSCKLRTGQYPGTQGAGARGGRGILRAVPLAVDGCESAQEGLVRKDDRVSLVLFLTLSTVARCSRAASPLPPPSI